MGILRIIYALSIVVLHIEPVSHYLQISRIAVQTFFIISGFYMSLILSEKYIGKNNKYSLFISNRFLRLYPMYWMVLLATFSLSVFKYTFHIGASNENAYARLIDFITHATPFIGIAAAVNYFFQNVTLIFTSTYFTTFDLSAGNLLIYQVHTLQDEMLFYLLAPFLVRKNIVLVILFYIGIYAGSSLFFTLPASSHTALTNEFLKSLPFFITGIFSYYVYTKIKTLQLSSWVFLPLFSLFVGITLLYKPVTFGFIDSDILYFIAAANIIPFVFLYFRNNKYDKTMGEFSYPVYICHLFVIKLLGNLSVMQTHPEIYVATILLGTFFVAFLLEKYVDKPIDILRQKRLTNPHISKEFLEKIFFKKHYSLLYQRLYKD